MIVLQQKRTPKSVHTRIGGCERKIVEEKKTPTNGSKFNREHTHARARAHTRIHNTNSVIMVYF